MARNDIVQPTITEYLDQLDSDKHGLVTFLNSVGLPSSDNDTFTVMIPKLQFIPSPEVDVGSLGIKFGSSEWSNIETRFNFSNVVNFNKMFKDNTHLRTLPNNFNSSSATNMSEMFYSCNNLNNLPLFNTINVTDMNNMFNGCTSLTTIPQFNTSNVTHIYSMFQNCSSLTTIPLINTSSATNMLNIFNGCNNLTSIPLLDTSNVTNMQGMFKGCSSLTIIPQFNTSKVSNMYEMFHGCNNLTTIPVLDTNKVTLWGGFISTGMTNLTDDSLNNILTMCINATSYKSTKTLYALGFRSTMYTSSRIQALSNYNDFITAGWTIGY